MKRNIVILGAAGFVGTCLRRELAGRAGVAVWAAAPGEFVDIRDEAALDPYSFTRDAWLQRRRNQVFDGRPPRDPEDDE